MVADPTGVEAGSTDGGGIEAGGADNGGADNGDADATVAGLVLAAGGGRRYGGPKALIEWSGALLVDRAVETLHDGGCRPVVAVLGAEADRVRSAARLRDVTTVVNRDWRSGMGSSLRAGLTALTASEDLDVLACVILLVDMPGVAAEAVRRVSRHATPDALVMAGYGERRGHPVLLGRRHWPGVVALAVGDTGAKPYLRRHQDRLLIVPCADVADDHDIDTPDDASRKY